MYLELPCSTTCLATFKQSTFITSTFHVCHRAANTDGHPHSDIVLLKRHGSIQYDACLPLHPEPTRDTRCQPCRQARPYSSRSTCSLQQTPPHVSTIVTITNICRASDSKVCWHPGELRLMMWSGCTGPVCLCSHGFANQIVRETAMMHSRLQLAFQTWFLQAVL